MQKSKARTGPSAVALKTSPVTPRPTRQSKAAGSEESKLKSPSSVSTPSAARSPNTKSPKPVEKKASRSPVAEKKPASRVSKLESQLTQVQEDLKKTKELLNSSESSKVQALEEASEAKKQYMTMVADFEDTKRQLLELSRSDVDQSATQDVDHAVNEIENVKLVEMESAVESDSGLQEKAEGDFQELVNETQVQLQVANSTIQSLHSDGLKVVAAFKEASSELEVSKCQISSLENTVSALRSEVDLLKSTLEVTEIKLKEEQIKSAVEMSSAEVTVNALTEELEQVKSSGLESMFDQANARIAELTVSLIEKENELLKVSNFNEILKQDMEKSKIPDEEVSEMKSNLALLKSELTDRENELQLLKSALGEVNELKSDLAEKDDQLKDVLAANERLKEEIQKLMENQMTAELKENLMDKETELQSISEENKILRMELLKKEEEMEKIRESALTELEATKSSQMEKTRELEQAADEVEKSNQRVNKLNEQLETARVANSEMEVEVKRMRVQTEQWRKAAEAAAAILNAGSNGKVSEKSGPIEGGEYLNFGGKVLSSPYSDEMEDSAAKTKKNNVLKKFGGLWKKGQK